MRWARHVGRMIACAAVLGVQAKADSGVAPAVAPTMRPPAPAIVKLVPNNIVDVGRSATVAVAWHFGSAEHCPMESRAQWADATYCVEMDSSVQPHRCVVTTSRMLRHVLLGEAVQRCFLLSRVIAQK